ncbi:hypothetical protein pdam_00021449 [Pocillopora damicornis]|uniref:Uncharacterized protein n=1 Tax=Pocillopora damicornis TaxID=46731 RepID=A0A3M6UD54_POCDA|nr:hypothetical protein pdam_00021449 [Pocillopora damicornis]
MADATRRKAIKRACSTQIPLTGTGVLTYLFLLASWFDVGSASHCSCPIDCRLNSLVPLSSLNSLLKWNELKKRKTELGKNINAVQEAIFNPKFGEQTSQISFQKMFLPITDKLDDLTNLIALALLFPKKSQKEKRNSRL